MSSVGKKLNLNFSRGKNVGLGGKGKKKSESKFDDLDPELNAQSQYTAYRRSSIGNLPPPTNLNLGSNKVKPSPLAESLDAALNHDDIISLTYEVRGFSEALAKLKTVFSGEDEVVGPTNGDLRVVAHDKLGEVLSILNNVLKKYPALHTTDVLTSAAGLITKIKSCSYEDISADCGDLNYTIDQLALAFSSSVSEYLMGDVDTYPLGKSKSYDNLVSGEGDYGSQENLDRDDTVSTLSPEELDNILIKCDSGMDLALKRAKAWSKYAKDIITYVEKRATLEAEYAKNLSKLAGTSRQSITEESFLPLQSVYCTALDQDIEYASTCQTTANLLQTNKFVEPLSAWRADHDKMRKNVKEAWMRELKKMQDCVANLRKAKVMYVSKQQEYEKARDLANKAEAESPASQQGAKKRKQEEDAMHRAIEAETTYKACVIETNNRQHELERVKGDILAQIRDLILQCDQTMRNVTVAYFQLQHTVTAPLPVQYQALCESSQQYEPGTQYAEYIRTLPAAQAGTHNTDGFTFEPYTPDSGNRLLVERKESNHSSESGSSDMQFLDDSPSQSPAHRLDKRHTTHHMKAWTGAGNQASDTDSVSGSSCRSLESSPATSPYSRRHHRPLVASNSMNELAEADRDAQFDSRVSLSADTKTTQHAKTYRGTTLSRAARTHVFKKLRAPSRCRECESYVYFQGAECQQCGLSSHRRCLETLHWECGQGPGSRDRRMTTFGVDFTAHIKETHTEIPHLIRKCTAEIDMRGLHVKGIYRLSGVKSKVEKLCQSFENDESNVDLSDHHPNVIANVLKLYLRQLPEPLLSFRLYPELIKLARESEEMEEGRVLQKLRAFTMLLPQANFRTCGMLMHHLHRVTKQEHINQMSASNMGIVFGPTLLRPSEGAASLNSLMDTAHQAKIVELLIKNSQPIFGVEDRTDNLPLQAESEDNAEIEITVPPSGEEQQQPGNPSNQKQPEGEVTKQPKTDTVAATDTEKQAEKSGPQNDTAEDSDTKWYVPAPVTNNLLDELAQEQPLFKSTEPAVELPGSMNNESAPEPTEQKQPSTPSTHDVDLASDDDDLDTFLPDDSSPANNPMCANPTKSTNNPVIASTTTASTSSTSTTTMTPSACFESLSAPSSVEVETSQLVTPPTVCVSPAPSDGSSSTETPTSSMDYKLMGSPGLRRKLLASELRTRDDSTLTPTLSKPRPYSPPLHRRLRPTVSNSSALEERLGAKSDSEQNNNRQRKKGILTKSSSEESNGRESPVYRGSLKNSPRSSPKGSPLISRRLLAKSTFYTPTPDVGSEKVGKDTKNGIHDLKLDKRPDVATTCTELTTPIDREPTYV